MSPQGLSHSFIILICVSSLFPVAVSESTPSTAKDAGTNSTSQATTPSTTTTTTTKAVPTTESPTSPTTTLPPAKLGDSCSSIADGNSWCDATIGGTAVCDGGLCACGSGFFRKDINRCLSEAVLTPENLTFSVINSTSLEVRWQMAESLIWKFDVRCTGTTVNKTKSQLDITVASFTDLTPGDEYSVIVTAFLTNDEATVYSGTNTAIQAIDPAKPGDIKSLKYTAPNISLEWFSSDGYVDRYRVNFQNDSYETTGNTAVALTNLIAGTTYEVTITAVRHNRESEERKGTFTTSVAAPSPPLGLAFDDLTNNSVLLQWAPPTYPNGNLTGYIVCYDEKVYKDMIDLTRSLCLNAGNVVSYPVEALKPGAFYNFTVYSTNTEYNSTAPAELGVTVQTFEAVPGKVTDLNVQAQNLSLVVTWKRPEEPNGNIIQYRIDWSSLNIDCTDCLNTNDSQTCPPAGSANCSKYPETSITVNEKDMDYTISSLEPFTNYTVTVTPYTSAGPGTSDSTTTKTSVVKPGPVRNVTATVMSSTAIEVRWLKPEVVPGPVNYTVRAEDMVLGQQISQGCAVEGIDTISCTVSGLEEYWVYQFVVIASTTAGDSEETRSGNYTTQEGRPGRVKDIRHTLFTSSASSTCDATKVVIEWTEPDLMARNSLITFYQINDNQQNRLDHSYEVKPPLEPYKEASRTFTYTFLGLNAESNYFKTIQAKTQGGLLGEEEQLVFTTKICAPPDWPSHTNISENSGKRTTSSFTVTMPTSFFLNNEQGNVRERGLIISKTNTALTLPKLLSAKATTWSTSKRNSFKDPYAITIEAPATNSIEIIVGENAECESQANQNTMCNGQLPPSQQFYVLAYACTSNDKCSHSNFFGAYATAALPAPKSPSNVPVIVGVLVAVGLLIIIVTLVLLQFRGVIDIPKLWRKDRSDKPPTVIDDPIQTKRPVRLSQFDDYLMELHKDTNLLFSCQYEDIGKLSRQIYEEKTTEEANLEDNKAKNRWVNILPFDHSRVKLQQLDDDDPTSDYINANFIPGLKHKREYIATQGPLPGTIDDFWRMVWEHNVSIIVMLTQCKEGNRGMGGEMMVKCENYWPTEVHEAKQYGDVVVNPVSVSTLNKYNITIFEVSVNNVKRTVHHFHYIEFPDMSAIVEYDIFLEFMQVVRGSYPRTMESPIVVHCSAGVGRTGTFIALDMLSQLLNRADFNWDMKVDIFDMVIGMRNHRTNMIQTESQYVMIHDCLSAMLELKKRATEEQNDNLYVNQSYDPYPEVLYENLKGNEMKTDL